MNPDCRPLGAFTSAVTKTAFDRRFAVFKILGALAAVRDGDVGDALKENIFKLPGTMPPEKEIFQSPTLEKYVA